MDLAEHRVFTNQTLRKKSSEIESVTGQRTYQVLVI